MNESLTPCSVILLLSLVATQTAGASLSAVAADRTTPGTPPMHDSLPNHESDRRLQPNGTDPKAPATAVEIEGPKSRPTAGVGLLVLIVLIVALGAWSS